MRHGDASEEFPVSSRQLSAMGREQISTMALEHRFACLGLEKVVSSTSIRAAQTAERFVTAADLTQRIEWLDDLTPQGDLGVIEEFLQNTAVETILMVSHLPLVEILIDLLIGESEACMGTGNPTSVSMPCAGRGTAQLNWIQHANGIY